MLARLAKTWFVSLVMSSVPRHTVTYQERSYRNGKKVVFNYGRIRTASSKNVDVKDKMRGIKFLPLFMRDLILNFWLSNRRNWNRK